MAVRYFPTSLRPYVFPVGNLIYGRSNKNNRFSAEGNTTLFRGFFFAFREKNSLADSFKNEGNISHHRRVFSGQTIL